METCPNKRFFLFNQIMNQTEIPQKREPKIKNRIRYCRLAINLSQKDLAFLMGVPASQVSRWETGEIPLPKMAELSLKYIAEKIKRKSAKQKGRR